MKLAQRDEIKEQQLLRRAGITSHREDSEPNDADGVDGAMDTG